MTLLPELKLHAALAVQRSRAGQKQMLEWECAPQQSPSIKHHLLSQTIGCQAFNTRSSELTTGGLAMLGTLSQGWTVVS